MARSKRFESEEVIFNVISLFCERDFEAVSINEIINVTGLSRSSIYSTFGNKYNLFIEAFDTYRTKRKNDVLALACKGTGAEALRNLLLYLMQIKEQGSIFNSCMTVTQAINLKDENKEIEEKIIEDKHFCTKIIKDTIIRGKNDGSIKSDISEEDAANILTNILPGLQIIGKKTENVELARKEMYRVLKVLHL